MSESVSAMDHIRAVETIDGGDLGVALRCVIFDALLFHEEAKR
jgi:hypothetical protein